MRIEGTALRTLENFYSLIRVGAPFDGVANLGQTVTIQYNPNLRDLYGLHNLAIFNSDSVFGGLTGVFGECGVLSDSLLRSGNVTWGLCQYPTYFVDQGSQGVYSTNPFAAGPCAVTEQCPQGLTTTDSPLQNNRKAYGICQVLRKGKPYDGGLLIPEYGAIWSNAINKPVVQYRCVPSVLTLLADIYNTKNTGSFFALATARGFADQLISPASRVTVFAPEDYAIHLQFGGLTNLLGSPTLADTAVQIAITGGTVPTPVYTKLYKGLELSTDSCLIPPSYQCRKLWVEGGIDVPYPALLTPECQKLLAGSVTGRVPFGSPTIYTQPFYPSVPLAWIARCVVPPTQALYTVTNVSSAWPDWEAKLESPPLKAANGVVYITSKVLL